MSKNKRKIDKRQLSIFDHLRMIQACQETPSPDGQFNVADRMRASLRSAIKVGPGSDLKKNKSSNHKKRTYPSGTSPRYSWRRQPDSNRWITVLQTAALATWLCRLQITPAPEGKGDGKRGCLFGAGNGTWTRDNHVGNVGLYHWAIPAKKRFYFTCHKAFVNKKYHYFFKYPVFFT